MKRGSRLPHDDVDDVLTVELATPPKEGLLRVVVVFRSIHEPGRVVTERVQRDRLLKRPAGESARHVLDIGLGVVANTHRKQLEKLPAVVLVWRIPVVLGVVEPVDHGGVARQLHQESPQVPETVTAQHLNVLHHRRGVFALGPASRKDVMPEERHLFLQRALRIDHAVEPAAVPDARIVLVHQVRVVAGEDLIVEFRKPLRIHQVLDDLLIRASGE